MIDFLMKLFGYDVQYCSEWGSYTHRYSNIDYNMMRPIHSDMTVAPPWAVKRYVRRG